MKRLVLDILSILAVAVAAWFVLHLLFPPPPPVLTKGINITVQTEVDLKDVVVAAVAGGFTWYKMRPRKRRSK